MADSSLADYAIYTILAFIMGWTIGEIWKVNRSLKSIWVRLDLANQILQDLLDEIRSRSN